MRSGGAAGFLLHGNATATANATDTTSGVTSQSCNPVDTSTAGAHPLACTAADNAGNATTQTIGYLVQYQILGFFSPVPKSKWKTGQSVPIKAALADANGVRIPDTDAQGLLSPTCRVTFSASGVQAVSACAKYDTTDLLLEHIDQVETRADAGAPRLGQVAALEKAPSADAEEVSDRCTQSVLEQDRVHAVLERAALTHQMQPEAGPLPLATHLRAR